MSDDLRFWSKVDKSGKCWVWTAATSVGYGQFRHDGRLQGAHRVSYEMLVGPIPEGCELDHVCRNTRCVNPAHLQPVTHRENARRGNAGQHLRSRTECLRGHKFTPENTYVYRGGRTCRECRKARQAAYEERQRRL